LLAEKGVTPPHFGAALRALRPPVGLVRWLGDNLLILLDNILANDALRYWRGALKSAKLPPRDFR
jgi:hypothetical protein